MMKQALLVLFILSGAANASDASMLSTISPQVTDNDCKVAFDASPASTSCFSASLVAHGETCNISVNCLRKDDSMVRVVNEFYYKDMSKLHNCDGALLPYKGC